MSASASQSRSRGPSPPDFRALFESAPGLYLVLTPTLDIIAVSSAYLAATMTRRDDILGRHLFEVFPDNPDDPAATGVANLRASLERVLAQGKPDAMAVQKYDIRRPEAEGGGYEERFWSPMNSPVLDAHGAMLYIIHRVEDVTEFVRLEQQGLEMNKVTEELRTRSAAMETEILRRAQDLQRANEQLRELQSQLEERVQTRTAELERANADLVREIAERQKAQDALLHSEDQLRQSQKLEAVGRLAGGVAHDFNNLLTVILSYSQVLLHDLAEDGAGRREIAEIQKAGERAAALTRQLLAFSRQQVLAPTVLDANDVLRGLSAMLGRVLGEDVELRLGLASEIGKVKVDRSQLEQVVMNLAVNSRDAMPQGGRLTIETADVTLDESYTSTHLGATPGPHVMISVSDTGVGMDRATQARVFEPFFTTKRDGKGTGLGLSTVFGIVKQSGGSIWLYSEPGGGTTFRVYLPHALEQSHAAAPAPLASSPGTGNETILLVEDEEQVRAVALRLLREAGYNVLEAPAPLEAVRIAETYGPDIHLLLTDVVMPKMNGRQVAGHVMARRPEIRVLFMSGYTDDVVLHHGVLESGVAFIQKPLTPDALLRKVRQVLDGPAEAAA
jgi:signal transduction histidine kinase/ActR/RegA family two-component response regulator